MAKINKYLSEWKEAGLIDPGQVQKILEYENKKQKKPWVMYGFIMLGAVILSIGIISIIAANWRDIPAWLKLALDIIILVLVAFGLYVISGKNKPAAFDALASLFVFLYLASIGLVSQIYHTGGQIYEALGLLAVVSLPVTLLSYKKFLSNAWAVIVLLAVILFCIQNIAYYDKPAMSFISIGILAALPFISSIAGNLFSFKEAGKKLYSPFIFWSVVFFMAGTFLFDLNHSAGNINLFDQDKANMIPYFLILNTAIAFAVVLFWLNKTINIKVKIFSSVLSLIYCIAMNYSMYFERYLHGYYKLNNYKYEGMEFYRSMLKYAGALDTIIVLLLFSFIFSSLNMRRLFNLMILLTGIRFLIIYFQVFGSLAYTGLGLMISGLLIIGFVVLWYKYSSLIERNVGRIFK